MVRPTLIVLSLSAICGSAAADSVKDDISYGLEGYYRTRGTFLTNLSARGDESLVFPPTGDTYVLPEIRRTSFLEHRGRLVPTVGYKNLASLKLQIDVFDDMIWGDNNGISVAPLFAVQGSNQAAFGNEPGERDSIVVKRAWLEFKVPAGNGKVLGQMRVGRMPSHWGMGLLANGGGTHNTDASVPDGEPPRKSLDHFFDDDFGDNHFGSTADRILFVTKPVSIFKAAMGSADIDSKIVAGYAFSKISEAPFLFNEPFASNFRPYGQQGFISSRQNNDVNEHVALVVYNDPHPNLYAQTDEIRAGVYGVLRHADKSSTEPSALDPSETCGEFEGSVVPCEDTGSMVFIADLWYRLRLGRFYSEGEFLTIRGESFGGIPFPIANRKKKASITSGVVRAGYMSESLDAVLEAGHASGDDRLEDDDFKQRSLHPDFNVGLILFEQVLRELSARTFGPRFYSENNPQGARGFFSEGGVINSNYLFPRVRYRPGVANLEVVGAVLAAWVDTLADTGTAMFYAGDGSYLGTEVDVAVKSRFAADHMSVSVEAGYLRFGDALKTVFPLADQSFTIQTRVAFLW